MLTDLLMRLLGRHRAWRLGRKLYMAARGEVPNDIETNGEADLMRQCIAAFAASGAPGPFIAFDIGANLGLWSECLIRTAAARAVTVRIELFEPVPGAFARLSAKFPGGESTRLHQIAISSRSGSAEMQIVGEFAGTNSLSASIDPAATALTVTLATADEMKMQLGLAEIHLLKMDAEGHDFEILRGMAVMLQAGTVQVIQFEYNWRWLMNNASLRAVFDLVRGTSYRVGRQAPDRLEIYDAWNPEADRFFENNYVLVRNDILPQLKHVVAHWDASNVLITH